MPTIDEIIKQVDSLLFVAEQKNSMDKPADTAIYLTYARVDFQKALAINNHDPRLQGLSDRYNILYNHIHQMHGVEVEPLHR